MNLSETQTTTADPPSSLTTPDQILGNKPSEKDPSARFRGEGTTFRAKIIGIDDVTESRGDKMCQDAILRLKAIVKASGQHKQKIVINISLNGIKIINLMNAQVMHEHNVDRISFIARDLTDRRAFGYIFGLAEGRHKFFGIKTAKPAEHVVLALRDLFQVVYDMKKKEVEVAKQQQVEEAPAEAVYAVPNNRPVKQPEESLVPQDGNLSMLQKELDNIHQMSDLDAFKNPWPENTPTSPDTPGLSSENDMFGMAPTPSSDKTDYSNDLAALSMNALEPAADGGAKLTKDEILSGFGQVGQGGMYQQQQANFFAGQQQSPFVQQQQPFIQQQQPTYSVPQRRAPPAPVNPFGGAVGAAPQTQANMGMFPPGPSPVVPARPGAMRPPTTTPAQTGAAQNPFGDAFGGAGPASDGLLAPANHSQSGLINGSAKDDAAAPDPFASLIPSMGSGSANKKDMFKDFQIAKPPQPPPRSNDSVSANFDSYFRASVGGVPVDETNNEPNAQQTNLNPPSQPQAAPADPFAMFGSTDADQTFNFGGQQSNNVQSLFG